MNNHTPVIDNDFLIVYYLEKEKDPAVKYRLAFLNSLQELKDTGYGLEKACDVFSIAIPTAYAWIRNGITRDTMELRPPFMSRINQEAALQSLTMAIWKS